MNAILLLKNDHEKVNDLFDEFDVSGEMIIAEKICKELDIHAQIEEQIFYPAVNKLDPEMIEQSLEEHQDIKDLIAELRAMDAVDENYQLAMDELRSIVEDHVEEEETQLFVNVESALNDQLDRLGNEMMKLKQQLMQGKAARTKTAS